MLELNKRLKGDSLLDALDIIDELKTVNTQIDEINGIITCYHRATSENVKNILNTRTMSSKENALYFSTCLNGFNSESYGNDYITAHIPVEYITIDDIFSNEAHIRIQLKNNSLNISNWL